MIVFTMQHLYFMLRIRTEQLAHKNTLQNNLASRRYLLFRELQDKDLVRVDDEGIIYISEKGDKILDETIYQFAELTKI